MLESIQAVCTDIINLIFLQTQVDLEDENGDKN